MARALSIEDKNLGTPSILTGRRVNYVDIDLTFANKPSGDVYKKTDAAAVKQSVKNIVLTAKGEKPFDHRFGAGLNRLLFDLIDADAEEELERLVQNAVESYEPRAKVLEVVANAAPDYNAIENQLNFQQQYHSGKC